MIFLSPITISLSLLKRYFTLAKLTGTLFAPFTLHTTGTLASLMILPSFASSITSGILLGMDHFIPSSIKPGKKNSPKWFNSQCAKDVKTKNHRFKQWKFLQTPQSRAFLYKHVIYAQNLLTVPKPLLSIVSTIKLLPARLDLAPFDP